MPILTGVRSGSFGNLRSAILASPSAPDDNILLDDDAKRPARTDAKRRLDIEIAGYKMITRASSALLRGFADGANKIAFALAPRTEERRAGKDGVSPGRPRCAP